MSSCISTHQVIWWDYCNINLVIWFFNESRFTTSSCRMTIKKVMRYSTIRLNLVCCWVSFQHRRLLREYHKIDELFGYLLNVVWIPSIFESCFGTWSNWVIITKSGHLSLLCWMSLNYNSYLNLISGYPVIAWLL